MDFYSFVEGPLLWTAFLIFIFGSLFRIFLFLYISREKDKILYQHFSWKYIFATWLRWLLPINKDLGKNPIFTVLGYIFHICLIVIPIWYSGHIFLWEMSRFEWSWTPIPDELADGMTLVLSAIALFFLLRRIISPGIRFISTFSDYILLITTDNFLFRKQ